MSDYQVMYLDNPNIKESVGFKDWILRQRAKQNNNDARSALPVSAKGAPRRAIRQRCLDLSEMATRAAAPVNASPATPARPSHHAAAPAKLSLLAASDGHFYAQALVDGVRVSMVVDTGATVCSLTEEVAEQIGLRLRSSDFTRVLSTQNGNIRVAPVSIGNIQVGSIDMRNVEAVVAKRVRGGENLLGMSFLKRLKEFRMVGGHLALCE